MGLMNAMKLGLAISSKLRKAPNGKMLLKVFLESVQGAGQFTVVDWSVLGKELDIFGNGKEVDRRTRRSQRYARYRRDSNGDNPVTGFPTKVGRLSK